MPSAERPRRRRLEDMRYPLAGARTNFLALALACLLTSTAASAGNWTIEIHSGNGLKPVPASMYVRQDGYPDVLVTDVKYETRPFSDLTSVLGLTENYYGLRVGYYPSAATVGQWDHGFEVEFLHDKAYFVSGTGAAGVINHFELSDGHNYLLTNVTTRYALLGDDSMPSGRLHTVLRAGLGPVITAPTSVIRGQRHNTRDDGPDVEYFLAGWGVQAAVQLRYFITPWYALSVESKFSGSSTTNTISNGTITTLIPTVHINVGFTIQTR